MPLAGAVLCCTSIAPEQRVGTSVDIAGLHADTA